MANFNDCYTRLRGQGLLKAIDKEYSGDIKKLLETEIGGLLDPAGYFAKRIRERYKNLVKLFQKMLMVFYLYMIFLTNNKNWIRESEESNSEFQKKNCRE